MRHQLTLLTAVLTLGLAVTAHAADDDDAVKDPTGTWTWEFDFGQGPVENTLVLQTDDKKVTGTYSNGGAEAKIEKGEFDGKKFTINFTLDLDGQELAVEMEGEVTNDELTGLISADINGEILEFDWDAERALSAADLAAKNPTGTWTWEYDYGQGPVDNSLTLKIDGKKVTGMYSNGDTEAKITKGEFDGKMFTAKLTLDLDGQELDVEMEGEVDGDELTGLITVDIDGEILEFDWDATRGLLASDVVGSWALEINSPDGQVFTPTIKVEEIDGKLSGQYIAAELGNYDLERIEINGSTLEFDTTVELDGNELALQFKGQPRGQEMAGILTYEVGGTEGEADFTGKKAGDEAEKDEAEGDAKE